MEISLSEKDMDALAKLVAAKIEERLLRDSMLDTVRKHLEERAMELAKNFYGTATFNAEAVEALRRALQADSERLLRTIVKQAVREVRAEDPELAKAVRRAVYDEACDAAHQAARLLHFD